MQIICTVDIRTRELYLEDVTIAAFDHLVDDVLFVIEPIDGFQLETSTIKIAAVGPLGEPHDYEIDPSTVTVDEETGNINFVWSIPVGVTAMPLTDFKISDTKKITFAVCAEIVSGDNLVKAWHSDDGTIKVKAHLEPESGEGEDPSEEATNAQKIAQLQTKTAILQREVASVAGGTPAVVEDASDMTDEDAIYILSTDGKWYYFDGSDWTPGGTYGGVTTDTTFSEPNVPADAEATGLALAEKADTDDLDALSDRVTALEEDTDTGVTAEQKMSLINFLSALGGAFITTDAQELFDAFLEAWADYYTISNTLSHCTTSNAATTVTKGDPYTATLMADEFYTLTLVTITMGGVDITASVYSNGVVSISEVTGALSITATAASDDEWESGVPYNIKWKEGYSLNNSTGAETETSGKKVSNYLPCDGLYFIATSGIYAGSGVFFYDENKTFIKRNNVKDNDGVYCKASNVDDSAAYFRVVKEMSDTSATVITPTVFPILQEGVTPVAGTKYQMPYINGKAIPTNGEGTKDSSTSFCSDYMPCYGFAKITKFPTGRCGGRFYDSNKAQLSSVSYADHGDYTIPEGAAYFRFEGGYTYNLSYPYVYLTAASE